MSKAAAKTDIWMPIYIGDYMSDTMHLTTEQHGAYLLLLMAAWKANGNLPVSDRKLSVIARLSLEQWLEIKDDIVAFFDVVDGFYVQKRLSIELSRATRHFESRRENGKLGGRPRKDTEEKPTGSDSDNRDHNREETPSPSPSPSPLPSKTQPPPPPAAGCAVAVPATRPAAKRSEPKRADPQGSGGKETKGAATWKAYTDAYFDRYGVEPVRNAKVFAQIAQLVDRLGKDDAPHVAAFFVHHNNSFYVAKMHATGILLSDAEKLRTEWATGRRITGQQARQIESRQANLDAHDGALAMLRQKGLAEA